jgi:hypothetical protein
MLTGPNNKKKKIMVQCQQGQILFYLETTNLGNKVWYKIKNNYVISGEGLFLKDVRHPESQMHRGRRQ